jgi:G3E family GTPase
MNSIPEAIQQLAHADRIILNKVDLFPTQDSLVPVVTDIRHINPTAVLITSTQSSVPIEEILNIQSFDVRRYERDNKGKNDEEGRRINITRGVFQIETNSEGKIILPKKKKRNRTRSEEKGDGQGQGQGEGEEEEIVRAEKLDIMKSDSVQEEGGVSTISLTSKKPLDLNQFNRWISSFLKEKGNDIYRFKGQHSHFFCFSVLSSLSQLPPYCRHLGDERI